MKSIRNQKFPLTVIFRLKCQRQLLIMGRIATLSTNFDFCTSWLLCGPACLLTYCCVGWSSIKHLESRLIVNQAPLCIVSPSTHRFNILEPVRSFCHCALAFSFSVAGRLAGCCKSSQRLQALKAMMAGDHGSQKLSLGLKSSLGNGNRWC